MKFITITELRLKATEIVREIETTREEMIVTKKGKPVILMQFITDEVLVSKKVEKKKEKEKRMKRDMGKSILYGKD